MPKSNQINFVPTFTGASPLVYQKADMLARHLAQENHTKTFEVMQQRHDLEICAQEDRHDKEFQSMRHNYLQQIMGTLQTDARELVGRLRAKTKARKSYTIHQLAISSVHSFIGECYNTSVFVGNRLLLALVKEYNKDAPLA